MTPQLSLVLGHDAMYQTNVDSLVECFGDMESVDLVRLGHNGHLRLRVSFRHCGSVCRGRRGRGSCFARASNFASRVCDCFNKTL
jgi:hypothetical protein